MTGLSGSLVLRRDSFTLEVSLAVEPCQTLAVIGPNGSGKSTLIAVLAGLLPLTGGSLRHGATVLDDPGAQVFLPAEDRGFALVPQDGLLFPHLTVVANVAFGLRHREGHRGDRHGGRRGRADRERRALAALSALDLADLAERRPSELSGGQAQRVAVARALALEAPVLLLDEPLSNIDVDNRQAIRKLLRTERPVDQIQVVVTHGREHALDADLVLAIEHGRALALAEPRALAADPPARWVDDLFHR
ncbi:MAG: ATP-binding cassette domain-containing protein [Acidimicrobiia bacterium]|nr:ATP-binding cassette domain-containing protein [Acidimicrobiia bacterium]